MYWPGAPEKEEDPEGRTSQFIEGLSYRSKGKQRWSSFTCMKNSGEILALRYYKEDTSIL
ncbi:MAG TPA: hypothetical protein PLW34_07995 [Termitinemataceae bacterium]|nr:hypothetical protein [Termitinemataceae bacterium]HOM23726.1 hypothetical protein [Termitinemataceae bacterium]HPQ00765.1 hypothetical protein [Termitinemataceae bacterium]